jgi:hypothetical protein
MFYLTVFPNKLKFEHLDTDPATRYEYGFGFTILDDIANFSKETENIQL